MEFPYLTKLVQKYGPKGFVLVTINGVPNDDEAGLLMMSRTNGGYLNLTAPDGDYCRANYNVSGYPSTFLLDADGKTVFTHIGSGPDNAAHMDAEIAGLLARAAGAKKAK